MLIERLHLKTLLSFRDTTLDLKSLNVLIGPNGSGKSNLMEAVGLLRACALDLNGYVGQGGGARAWIWNGTQPPASAAQLDATFTGALQYSLRFAGPAAVAVEREVLQSSPPQKSVKSTKNFHGAAPAGFLAERDGPRLRFSDASLPAADSLLLTHSLLSQFRLPADPTPISGLAAKLAAIRIYRSFDTGKNGLLRQGNAGTGGQLPLDETGQNLALVLHEFEFRNRLAQIQQRLRDFSPELRAVKPHFENGRWTVYLEHEGLLDQLPGARISDGTLKFLCLLAVLLDPNPPPLICIEEPEAGLHPDAIRAVGDALLDASERTQLLVATHSADLVDALTGQPESVLVFEKELDHSTSVRRLEADGLAEWLERYSLGELWRKGEIGGNRW